MSDLALILAMGAITFASRVSFMWRKVPIGSGDDRPFLHLFPVALFISLATAGVLAPTGELAISSALAAGAGGLVGAAVTRRSLLGTVVGGAVAYWLTRLVI